MDYIEIYNKIIEKAKSENRKLNRNAIARNKKGNMSKVKGYNIIFENEG